MDKNQRKVFVGEKMIEAAEWCTTMEDLLETLMAMSYAVGGMICEFQREDREKLLMQMAEMMGMGMMTTANEMGQPSDLEMVIGERS